MFRTWLQKQALPPALEALLRIPKPRPDPRLRNPEGRKLWRKKVNPAALLVVQGLPSTRRPWRRQDSVRNRVPELTLRG